MKFKFVICIVLYCNQYSNIFLCANTLYHKGHLEINLRQKKLYHNFKGNLQFFQKETLGVLIHLKQNHYGNCKLLFSKVSISRLLKPTITFLWQYFVNISIWPTLTDAFWGLHKKELYVSFNIYKYTHHFIAFVIEVIPNIVRLLGKRGVMSPIECWKVTVWDIIQYV